MPATTATPAELPTSLPETTSVAETTEQPSSEAERQQLPPRTPLGDDDLAELIQEYWETDSLPQTTWLTRLNLDDPRLDTRCLGERTRLLKRLTDIGVSATLLILLSPVFVLLAIAVKLTSRGPIIFRQDRVGLNLRRNRGDRRHRKEAANPDQDLRQEKQDRRQQFNYGKPFVLYKFRTMTVNAEANGAQFAQKNDPRITKIGRFLRKTRLDELPQLWNVLRGEMTLVGPRPERPEFIEKLSDEIPNYLNRLGLKPGLTGLAQVINGYDNDIEGFQKKVALDLLYLQNCCFKNDWKIMLRTIRVILTGSGAL